MFEGFVALTVDDFAQNFYRQLLHEGGRDDCSIKGRASRVRGSKRGACDVATGKVPEASSPRSASKVSRGVEQLDSLDSLR